MSETTVWVFVGEGARFPSGIFRRFEEAESWIARHGLTGVLTEYPVGQGVYDLAVESGEFIPKKPEQREAKFIGSFSSAKQAHHHYENGSSE